MHRMTFWVIVLHHINTQFPSHSFSGCLGRWKLGHAQARFSFLASTGLPVLTRWACTRAVDKLHLNKCENTVITFLKKLENSVDICSVWKLLICSSTRIRVKMFPVLLQIFTLKIELFTISVDFLASCFSSVRTDNHLKLNLCMRLVKPGPLPGVSSTVSHFTDDDLVQLSVWVPLVWPWPSPAWVVWLLPGFYQSCWLLARHPSPETTEPTRTVQSVPVFFFSNQGLHTLFT